MLFLLQYLLSEIMKERWSYDKFIEAYNKIAKEQGRPEFNENILPQRIEKSYDQSSGRSIEEFVKSFFQYRQQSELIKKSEDRGYQRTDNIGWV